MRTAFPCCDELDRLIASAEGLLPRIQAVVDHDPHGDLSFDLYNITDELADLRTLREQHRAFHDEERRRIVLEAECVVLNAVADDLAAADAMRRIEAMEKPAKRETVLDWSDLSRFAALTARYAVYGWLLKHGEWPTPEQAWGICADEAEVDLPSARALVGHALDTGEVMGMPTAVAIREGTAKGFHDAGDYFRLYVDEKHHEAMRTYWDYEHRVERLMAELLDEQS